MGGCCDWAIGRVRKDFLENNVKPFYTGAGEVCDIDVATMEINSWIGNRSCALTLKSNILSVGNPSTIVHYAYNFALRLHYPRNLPGPWILLIPFRRRFRGTNCWITFSHTV